METKTEIRCNVAPGGAENSYRGLSSFHHHDRWPRAVFQSLVGSVDVATAPSQMQAIGRLRYDLYVARDGKQYEFADPENGLLLEPVDAFSLNFLAVHGDRLLSAVRLTWARDALVDPHLAPIIQAMGGDPLDATVVCSRFVVLADRSAQTTIVPLFRQAYRICRIVGVRCCLLATRSELIPIFERFGFRKMDVWINDPIAGVLHLLRLDEACDLRYLESIRSPLSADARMLAPDAAS